MSASDTTVGQACTAQRSSITSIAVISIAAFMLVTTEFIIVGLLPALAADLNISVSMAGQLVTLFALAVAISGPVMTAWLSNVERRFLFSVILVVFAISNSLSAIAPNYTILAISRLVSAVLLPVFWGTASETAAQLVPKDQGGKAVSQVYLGVSAALLLGVPLGTVAAGVVGWRGTFWILACLCLAMAVVAYLLLPKVKVTDKSNLKALGGVLKNPYVLANLLLSLIIFTGMFTSYTYLANLFQDVAHIPSDHVGWWLMGFGAVGLYGNQLAGRFVDRHPVTATVLCAAALAVGTCAAVLMADIKIFFVVALIIWGIAHTAMFPLCQVRVMNSSQHAKAFAGTLNISAANAGIGFGAMLGGWVISVADLPTAAYVASALAVAALIAAPLVQKLKHKRA